MENLIEMYLKYWEQFLTIERFAEFYGLDVEDAEIIIEMGKKYRERRVEMFKTN